MKQTTLVIRDQVNVKFDGLDPFTRRKISEALKFFVPYARHMPAFKLGRWDGKVGFATVGGGTYLNLLDRVLPLVMEEGYDIVIDDRREAFHFEFPEVSEDMFAKMGKVWPEGHPIAGQPVELRDYQVGAIKTYLKNLQSIQSISTGAGKTLLTAALSAIVEEYGRSIIIVPSKSLVEQTEEDYRNLGLDVGVFYGDRKEWGHKHTICTWQSLTVFSKKEKRGELDALGITMADFLEEVVCVMVDETHSAKANELKELLCGPMAHIPIRWGLTGTVPKEEYEYLSLVVSLGEVVGEIKASDLQDKGVLANCHVDILQLIDSVEYPTYHDEYEYLCSDRDRLAWIGDYVRALSETGNTVILVDRIETGEFLQEHIPGSTFINGKVKTKDRSKEYKAVQSSEDKIIIATYGVAAVGINIPRIFNLVLLEAGKSFVRVIQSIGRGIRKAHDKDFVNIVDLCSTAKFSSRHISKRRSFYKEANYPNKTRKVDFRKVSVVDAIQQVM
jgi:superfamily II DNA or RNA helicase